MGLAGHTFAKYITVGPIRLRKGPLRRLVKTRLRSVFGSIKTPSHHKQIEYSAFYEVVLDDTSFRAEFLHGLFGGLFVDRLFARRRAGHSLKK
jgi:hypothetical protein